MEVAIIFKRNSLKARVIIYINSEGRVIHYRFVEKSGNEEFDARVLKSIQQSQPFSVPGEEIRDRLISEGVILGFPFINRSMKCILFHYLFF